MVTTTRAQLNDRGTFAGEISTPDAAGYDDARRVWNATFDRAPSTDQPTAGSVVTACRGRRSREP